MPKQTLTHAMNTAFSALEKGTPYVVIPPKAYPSFYAHPTIIAGYTAIYYGKSL